jgi:hypothetical protein
LFITSGGSCGLGSGPVVHNGFDWRGAGAAGVEEDGDDEEADG